MKAFESLGNTLNEYFYASLISACGVSKPPNTIRAELAFAELVGRGLRVQKVKKVLGRVLGERRAAQLIDQATKQAPPSGSILDTNAIQLSQGARVSRPAAAHGMAKQNKPKQKYSSQKLSMESVHNVRRGDQTGVQPSWMPPTDWEACAYPWVLQVPQASPEFPTLMQQRGRNPYMGCYQPGLVPHAPPGAMGGQLAYPGLHYS
jgi:hypothetical protein